MKTILPRIASMAALVVLAAGCDNVQMNNVSSEDEDKIETIAEDFADSYFNWQYRKAADMATPESGKWLRMAATQITEADVKAFKEQAENVGIDLNSIDQTSDTTAVAEYQLENLMVKDLLSESPRLVADTTIRVNLVRRNGKWLADLSR